MIIVSHPTGNANVRGLLNGLHRNNLLLNYYTTFGYSSDAFWFKALPKWLKKDFVRRTYELPLDIILSHPWFEIKRLVGISLKIAHSVQITVDEVYRDLDNHLSSLIETNDISEKVNAIYGYEDGCINTFRAAKAKGWQRFYELPIGYWRAAKIILDEEAELQPEWAVTMPALSEPKEKLERKDEELRLASHVFVASKFTLQTLDLAPVKLARISVIPYGAPSVISSHPRKTIAGKPLRVLYVGGLSQRKGLSYLFDAVEQLGNTVDLTIVGRSGAGYCRVLEKHLGKHNWIESMPHNKILECMREHDVFVFPSLFEGFGLVILEALSQGVPVITTPHTGGPDILDEGKDGFIVPIRSVDAIKEKLELLQKDPELLMEMKQNALEKAKQLTWRHYGDAIVQKLETAMNSRHK